MKRLIFAITITIVVILFFISLINLDQNKNSLSNDKNFDSISKYENVENNFIVDKVYRSKEHGDIHYSVYIPEDYNKDKVYPLYISLPGYEGLYFQGIGKNLEEENFVFEANKINSQMLILAPQLNDWGYHSANQTIALIEYYKDNYNIGKIYANGYSGGGETMSLVLEKRADLIDAYLHVSSQWDGELTDVIENKIPIYFVIGKNDEYYGSDSTINTYNSLYSLYEKEGIARDEIDKILVLDIKNKEYFVSRKEDSEHSGGRLVANDKEIMEWLFSK